MKKALALIILFYAFALFQGSFLVFFSVKGFVINIIVISVILINAFENQKSSFGLFSAFVGGFFLDIFSGSYLGLNILILAAASIFIKQVLKKYFQMQFSR